MEIERVLNIIQGDAREPSESQILPTKKATFGGGSAEVYKNMFPRMKGANTLGKNRWLIENYPLLVGGFNPIGKY